MTEETQEHYRWGQLVSRPTKTSRSPEKQTNLVSTYIHELQVWWNCQNLDKTKYGPRCLNRDSNLTPSEHVSVLMPVHVAS